MPSLRMFGRLQGGDRPAGTILRVNSSTALTIRPLRRWRATGWAFLAFGLLFGLAGIGGGDVGVTVSMLAFGLLMAAMGLSGATAAVHVDSDLLLYRNGWARRIDADDVAGVRLSPGSGGYYNRVAIFVDRRRGGPVRLTALQLPDTAAGRERLAVHAADMERVLGGDSETH